MRLFYLLLIFCALFFSSCSKPKTVLICGDHICVNKAEAQQYFEENLTLEVKIIHKKNENQIDLVELNLEENNVGKRKIKLVKKVQTDKDLKKLSKKEVIDIKETIKKNNDKKKEKKDIQKKVLKKNEVKNKVVKKSVNKKQEDIVDVCTILDKCNIEEISKYLLKKGREKGYPDLTKRQ